MSDYCTPPKYYTNFPACFQKYPGRCQKKNPGSIQELHALARAIQPKFFDGFELNYFHRLAPNKHITCNWVLSHTRPSGFRFGGVYVLRVNDGYLQTPIINADINPSTLASNFGIVYYPFQCLRLAAELQRSADSQISASENPLKTQLTAEWTRPCATLTLNLYDVSHDTGRSTLSFMRTITDHWSLGAELLLEWTDPQTMMAETAFAARYAKNAYAVAATASRQGVDVSYWHRLHNKIQMASMFAWNRKTGRAIGSINYQWDFNDAVVRCTFNSDLMVGFLYTRTLPHIPCTLGMSLLIGLPTDRFIFGLKLNLDPSGLRRGD